MVLNLVIEIIFKWETFNGFFQLCSLIPTVSYKFHPRNKCQSAFKLADTPIDDAFRRQRIWWWSVISKQHILRTCHIQDTEHTQTSTAGIY